MWFGKYDNGSLDDCPPPRLCRCEREADDSPPSISPDMAMALWGAELLEDPFWVERSLT